MDKNSVPICEYARIWVLACWRHEAAACAATRAWTAVDTAAVPPVIDVKEVRSVNHHHRSLARDERMASFVPWERPDVA